MTLRQKFIVAFAAVAVLVAVLVGSFSYIIAARNLHIEVDRSLAAAAATLSSDRDASANTGARAGGSGTWTWGKEGIIQTARTIAADGSVTRILGPDAGIPISADDQALAAANAASGSILFENATVGDGSHSPSGTARAPYKSPVNWVKPPGCWALSRAPPSWSDSECCSPRPRPGGWSPGRSPAG